MTQPAKVLAPADLRRLNAKARRGRHAARNQLIVALSFKAGLRACDIAGLDWSMAVSANGRVAPLLNIAGTIAKNGRGRHIPIHPDLRMALNVVHREQWRPLTGPVILSQRGSYMTARSVVNWFATLYSELGMQGWLSQAKLSLRSFIKAVLDISAAELNGCYVGSP